MTLTLRQTATAVGAGGFASFGGTGGAEPYAYTVLPSGAGGTIDITTGDYTAPAAVSSNPRMLYDTIQVEDYAAATATAQILVGTPLLLFCEILQRELGLSAGRVYLWDQKIMQPTDDGLYIAVSVPSCKPFANVNRNVSAGSNPGDGMTQEQFIAMYATVDIDIISRGPAARDRKEEIILALGSNYAQQQQNACGFNVGKLPPNGRFINLSEVDGAAIPYRYRISVAMQYAFQKTQASQYFDTFTVTEDTDA